MFNKLDLAEDRFREIEQLITLPHIVSDNKTYSQLMKEYKNLTWSKSKLWVKKYKY